MLGRLYKLSYIRRPELWLWAGPHHLSLFFTRMGRKIYTLREPMEPGQTLGGKAPRMCYAWHYHNRCSLPSMFLTKWDAAPQRTERRCCTSPLLLLLISPGEMFADHKGIRNNLGKHPVVLLSHSQNALEPSLHSVGRRTNWITPSQCAGDKLQVWRQAWRKLLAILLSMCYRSLTQTSREPEGFSQGVPIWIKKLCDTIEYLIQISFCCCWFPGGVSFFF